jgi:hypothetical protein
MLRLEDLNHLRDSFKKGAPRDHSALLTELDYRALGG